MAHIGFEPMSPAVCLIYTTYLRQCLNRLTNEPMVLVVGLEPTRLSATDFESASSAIPTHRRNGTPSYNTRIRTKCNKSRKEAFLCLLNSHFTHMHEM